MRRLGLVAFAAYVATVFGANWALGRYGIVNVLGFAMPAGVFFAGLAFTLRDITQDTLGRMAVVAAILVGAACSWFVASSFAVASAVAFLFSELADFAVYTPLRERGWLRAVAASNVAGMVVDSALFLWLAFGSLEFIRGQIVGKGLMTVAAILLLLPFRKAVTA